MSKARTVFIFPNGNVAVTDEAGQQMPEYQGGFLNCAYARRLARLIVRDNPEVNGSHFLLNDYLPHYRKYPHLATEDEEPGDHARVEALEREVAALKRALQPFAHHSLPGFWTESDRELRIRVTEGQLCRAWMALNNPRWIDEEEAAAPRAGDGGAEGE